jgi:hypothetical protein
LAPRSVKGGCLRSTPRRAPSSGHCDNPIQKGRFVAVRLSDGSIDPAFTYCSTGTCSDATRGGGVWSGVAVWNDGVYATTGSEPSTLG